nr:MAG TPA: hypothetical protein [Caudoviricetes sp.]
MLLLGKIASYFKKAAPFLKLPLEFGVFFFQCLYILRFHIACHNIIPFPPWSCFRLLHHPISRLPQDVVQHSWDVVASNVDAPYSLAFHVSDFDGFVVDKFELEAFATSR